MINLISASNSKDITIPNQEIFEYSVNNVILPAGSDTFYYCKLIEIPSNLTQKRHILRVFSIDNFYINKVSDL